MYRHYFRCVAPTCGKHMTFLVDSSIPVSPGRTHYEALENGAEAAMKADKGKEGCLGALAYCPGTYFEKGQYKDCIPAHRGSVAIIPQPEPAADPEWDDFKDRVSKAWSEFKASGYAKEKRGVNNQREYKPPASVSAHLQAAGRSGGVISIGGAQYVVSSSNTAGASLHRAIPEKAQSGYIVSFIFHL